jgi:hypothetical protein
MNSNIFDTLKKLSESERNPPMYIYMDEQTNQIKEIPLKDMAASALINKTVKHYKNSAKEIHDFMFGKY